MLSLLHRDCKLEHRLQKRDDRDVGLYLRMLFSRSGDTYDVPRFIYQGYQNLVQRMACVRMCSTP
jgi:hypothetical protein